MNQKSAAYFASVEAIHTGKISKSEKMYSQEKTTTHMGCTERPYRLLSTAVFNALSIILVFILLVQFLLYAFLYFYVTFQRQIHKFLIFLH